MAEIQSLTALRGLAAIWIVLHHFWPQTDSATPYLISKGYLAVDLFFILSGVVLYLVYSDALRAGTFNLQRFALKRFARLYPVHFVTLFLATGILTLGPSLGFEGRKVSYDFVQMFFLHATLLHAWGISETGGLNYPSWSLSAESFAYLLFPLLARLVIRARNPIFWSTLFLIIAIAGLQLFWPHDLRNSGDNLVFTRLENDFGVLRIVPDFMLGLAIAKYVKTANHRRVWFGVGISLLLFGFALDLDPPIIIGFAALIAASVILNPNAPRCLRRLGELSYSIYMTHALVQITGFKTIETIFGYPDGAVPVGFLIPLIGITTLCAWAMHAWCERPARQMILSLSRTKSARPKDVRSFPM